MGPARLLVLGAVLVLLAGFFIFLTRQVTAPNMALLYGNLDFADASEIAGKLEAMGVPYELKGDGTQILVPSDQVLHTRMALAKQGLPGGGTVGYEIFDRSQSLGTTSLVQNVNLLRALEGELSRTISTLSQVAAARVHLVIPRRQLFTRRQPEASASVVLKMRGAARLDHQQVVAIQNLVAAAVPGLKPARIAIVDDRGVLLARGQGEGTAAAAAASADQARIAIEERLKNTIERLLEQTVGVGKARAEVSAEITFDNVTTNAEIYDPDGQVVRSRQVVEEHSQSNDSEPNPGVTAGNNLPKADDQTTPETQSSSTTARTEETVNYEVTRTVKSESRQGGRVKRLSVAVLVDGRYETAKDGTTTYVPRSKEELEKLTQLVKTAVGYDPDRGDTVEVVNMRFAAVEAEPIPTDEPTLGLRKSDYFKLLEIIVLGFVAVLVVLMVLRPLVSRVLSFPPAPADAAGQAGAPGTPAIPPPPEGQPAQIAAQPGASEGTYGPPPAQAAAEEEADPDSMIDIARVEGRVRASAVKKIGEIVDKHPDEAMNIMRNWMYQNS